MTADENFAKLNLALPPPPAPLGVYKPFLVDAKHCYVSGHGPVQSNAQLIIGRIGVDMNADEGKLAARQAGLTILATLKKNLGSFNHVKRVIKVLGMVNCTPYFIDQSKVMNGYSDLMVEVFGEKGKHARSSVGMCSLPFNIAVEVEMIVEVED